MTKFDSSPIVAIATPAGRGGVGVIRISGKSLAPLLQTLFGKPALPPRHASYLPFKNADGSLIDKGLAIYFQAPHSYTGEDVLELQGHGGPIVLQMLQTRCLEAGQEIGLRLAEPGEFTRRAFLNDKLDLAQAEAVADLIDASTEAAARSASRSLSGVFSKSIHELVAQITHLRMLVEATLDFPEEAIDFFQKTNASQQLTDIQAALDEVFIQAAQGALLREGLNVVLAGPPNVGKSSLLNALAGAEIAIVTPIAGTTRDKVTETIQIEGVPVNLIDTAGLRPSDDAGDEVERIGIERAWNEVGHADVILHLLDADRGPTRIDEEVASGFPEGVPVIRVWNKIDLSGHKPAVDVMDGISSVYLSSFEKTGIDLLRAELLRIAGWQPSGESLYLARERHLIALKNAHDHLDFAMQRAAENDQSLDLFAEELRLMQEQLGSITGAVSSDDLLGMIFSRFCIGK
ncbi:MAG: tRNA uridine-5-carboxymethylaminomethyl(34) synthesis GTPase MnmE [Burkholderiaceae bacterium]|nr:tRNA uridine-5-carboxymethylaminomethyl(34) synthesis GTPase MnmE [Burkholderiaceae bacterium]